MPHLMNNGDSFKWSMKNLAQDVHSEVCLDQTVGMDYRWLYAVCNLGIYNDNINVV